MSLEAPRAQRMGVLQLPRPTLLGGGECLCSLFHSQALGLPAGPRSNLGAGIGADTGPHAYWGCQLASLIPLR